MKILIPTQLHDIHAKVVARALSSQGHDPVLWYGSDLPSRQTLSLELDEGEARLSLDGPALASRGAFDVVWLRRPVDAVLPTDMHPGDRVFAEREWSRVLRGIWHTVGREALWVNPWANAVQASSKPRQLLEASHVGMSVPRTLCSNDPDRIRSFIRGNPGETIYKPFCTSQWKLEEGAAYLFTAVVGEDDLPEDEVLRLCPGIFQPRVPKSHELRVTIIGDRVFGAELASQALEVAQVDWRVGTRAIEIRPTTLDPALEARCRRLMERLGLVFGCLDFIVTPEGEPVFLEINQMGQFLWLEELMPELRLLDAFCAMLSQGRRDFEWSPERATLRFGDLHDPRREAALDAVHVAHPVSHLLDDGAEARGAA
ncbi:MvdC/MvdD family ATP grasp protein [Paraliomyxa miuraensis]|uniref:MvdC/MvdD family ATP grasp protein n=1 Tax=Paraliomyxa miuraensis TaxID=376150 RepID=UPI0022552559|nr:hypothetical protein [Paraliomyxa miuraensis]MCX4240913.1 hypothetical protein [Paraliomyxa miuraensis]